MKFRSDIMAYKEKDIRPYVKLIVEEEGKITTTELNERLCETLEFYGHEPVCIDYNLIEQEIKDYDERYFAFAVKVEELEK